MSKWVVLQWSAVALYLISGAAWYFTFVLQSDCYDALSKSSANPNALAYWQEQCDQVSQKFEILSWGFVAISLVCIWITWFSKGHRNS
jgi:hypothetical protein